MTKLPLLVHIWFHPTSKNARRIARFIHTELNEDEVLPGLRIPTAFCPVVDDKPPAKERLELAENSFVVVLADDELCVDEDWCRFVADTWLACEENQHRCIPIQLTSNAWPLDERLNEVNFGRAYLREDGFQRDRWITRRVVIELCRYLKKEALEDDESQAPIQLFLSHAKADLGKEPKVAQAFIDSLKSDQPVKAWVDSGEIETGSKFSDAIVNGVENTSLLAIQTDNYSNREWCREEVMLAKENERPIVVINALTDFDRRDFPYLTNVPTLRFNDDPYNGIDLLLKETLRHLHTELLFNSGDLANEFDFRFMRPPEPATMLGIEPGKKILYPDPPLGINEIKRLSKSKSTFVTPLEHFAQDRSLVGKRIAVSMSESSDIERWGMDRSHMDQFMLEISRHLLIRGATLAYGGHLGAPGYTQKLFELVRTYNNQKEAKQFERIVNFRGWPLPKLAVKERAELMSVCRIETIDRPEDVDETLHPDLVAEVPKFFPGDVSAEQRFAWCRGMTEMRAYQADPVRGQVVARVVLGGTFQDTIKAQADGTEVAKWYNSRMPGVLEEVLLSIKYGQPVFLIGALGGVAKMVANLLQGKGHHAADWQLQSQAPFAAKVRDLYASRHQNWWYYDNEPRLENLHVDDSRSIVEFLADAWKPQAELNWETCINPLTKAENLELFETPNLSRIAELLDVGLSRI